MRSGRTSGELATLARALPGGGGSHVEIPGPRGATEIAKVVPALREARPDLPAPTSTDPDEDRFRLLEAITAFLKKAAVRRPQLLILEDLQWADPSSLLMLGYLAGELGPQRLLVLATFREEEIGDGHPLSRTLAEASRHELTRRIQLDGLSRDDVARLVEGLFRFAPSEPLIDAIHGRTEGNPFFVRQLVEILVAEHPRLRSGAGEVKPDDLEASLTAVPPALNDVIGNRFARLSEGCRQILRTAAVMGQEFDAVLLSRVSGDSAAHTLQALDEAREARFVQELPKPGPAYQFVHSFFRHWIHAELAQGARARIHLQIGEALEALYQPFLGPHLAPLAHHFFESLPLGPAEKALDYTVQAGELARWMLSFEEAASLFERGLKALELHAPEDFPRRARILIALGTVLDSAGRFARSEQIFAEAAAFARRAGSPELLAAAAIGYGRIGTGIMDERAVDLLEEALAALGDEERPLLVWTTSSLVLHLANQPRKEQRLEELLEANVPMARRLGEPHSVGLALSAEADALSTRDGNTHARRLALLDAAVALGEATQDPFVTVVARFQRLGAMVELGDRAEMDAEFQRLSEQIEKLRMRRWRFVAPSYQAMIATLEGRFDEAISLAHQSYTEADARNYPAGIVAVTTEVERQRGGIAGMVGILEAIARQVWWLPVRPVVAEAMLEAGQRDAARRILEELAPDDFAAVRKVHGARLALCILANVAATTGHKQHCATLYDLLEPSRELCLNIFLTVLCLGPISLYLGRLATVVERWDEAEACFESSLVKAAALGAPTYAVHTQEAHARMLLARDRGGDAARAFDLLKEAETAARALGMEGVVRSIESLRTAHASG